MKAARLRLGASFALALVFLVVGAASSPAAGSPNLVISQVYGGGGNSGAPLRNDYIELFNRGTTDVVVDGWSVQYASTIGTNWQKTDLSGTVPAGGYLLVQEAAGANTLAPPLPQPDVTGTIPMAAGAGKVVLRSDATLITAGTSCPADTATVDIVGYGTGTNCFEGSGPTATLSNTTAALRALDGCRDTDDNASDFATGAPAPRNAGTTPQPCPSTTVPTITVTTSPADPAPGSELTIRATATPGTNPTSTGLSVTCDLSWAGLTSTAPLFDDGTNGDATSGDLVFTRRFTIPSSTSPGTRTASCRVSDDQTRTSTASYTVNVTEAQPLTPIHEIQGAAHTSPLLTTTVTTTGIVTAKRSNGYYLQDPNPDSDLATSEAIFVFTSSTPSSVNVGDSVRVRGNVAEFRPGGSSSANLATTELSAPTTSVLSSGNPLPAPTVVGAGGRVPPTTVIDNDGFAKFDPEEDGIDFYESLEAMRLQVNDPVVVGPRNSFGEVWVLGDNGAAAAVRTTRGGIVIRPTDFNPERIQLDDAAGTATPNANVGDHLSGAAIGVLDYDFGNFEIEVTEPLTRVADGVAREATAGPAAKELAVATFNVENLDAAEPQSKFDALAHEIVDNLRSPDVIALEEIQDNNGATNDSVVAADATLNKLAAAVQAAGGPAYDWRQINPVDDQDGGEPGGNIRVGFFFRTDRGLTFVDRPGGDSTTPTSVVNGPGGPQLSASPGRVDPANTAWNASRKPLAGEFRYRGETFFLIANHFNSKGGDQPLFGRFQPPARSSEVQRHQQAQIVNDFVDSLLGADPDANIVVLGDINDFEFSQTMAILEGGVLHDLMNTLPQSERYSYVFEGNSQTLDHIVVSDALFAGTPVFDPVHVNAEFFDQLSDHDPSVARFTVVVTFESLCEFVRRVVTSVEVADGLCEKLAAAAAADARGNTGAKEKQLRAFRDQVDAQIGKSIAPADAETLKALSREL